MVSRTREDFAASLRARIEREYADRGDRLGWRMFYSPLSSLDDPKVALIGLNPGGGTPELRQEDFAMETASAYEVEEWVGHPAGESPLQKQICGLFRRLDVKAEDVLSGNLVPFRSADWRSLRDPKSAVAFGERIWSDVLARARPDLVIVLGNEVFPPIDRVLRAGPRRKELVGWGKVSAIVAEYHGGTLVRLPHLSRFRIVGRRRSDEGLRRVFGVWWKGG